MSLSRTRALSLLSVFLLVGCTTSSQVRFAKHSDKPLVYPESHKVDQVDTFHGVQVADPYRWLEELDSPKTQEWVEAQNKVTFGYLNEIPARDRIGKRLTQLWNYEKYSMPYKEGDRYFYYKNDGLQNQYVLYTQPTLDAKPRVLLDPNTLSADGTVALSGTAVSKNGKYLAYGLSTAGSDWQEWRVRDIETGQDLDDHLQWIKFSGAAWTHDHQGFYYSRYDEPESGTELKQQNYNQKLFYHHLGTDQSKDRLVYERPDKKEWGFGGSVTEDGRYLTISVWKGTERKNLFFYQDLAVKGLPVVKLIHTFEAQYSLIGNEGPIFWFRTDLEAPRYRVVAIDIRNPDKYNWKEVIPQTQETLRGVGLVNNMFVTNYMKDAHTQIKVFGLDGSFIRNVDLPGIGTAGGFGGKKTDTETFYSFRSFTAPSTIYRYDMKTGKRKLFRQANVDFDPNDYVVKQIFYHSKDGTRIPMFITHKKGLKLDGNNPTYLYGYGGFNVSLTPYFSVSNLVWMEMGGVYAMPNIRGGGEYGKEWHETGMKLSKQNVFDDFIAAAEWLIKRWIQS